MSLKSITWLIFIIVTSLLVVDQLWTNYLSTELFFKSILTMFIFVIAGVSISMLRSKPSKNEGEEEKPDQDKK